MKKRRKAEPVDPEKKRQAIALLKWEKKGPTNYRQAERIFNEARRNASTAEVVTSWAGVVQ